MPTEEKRTRKITIDYSDNVWGVVEIQGYVEYDCHELDGSRTILIRTKPRKSVQEFMNNEITGSNNLEEIITAKLKSTISTAQGNDGAHLIDVLSHLLRRVQHSKLTKGSKK